MSHLSDSACVCCYHSLIVKLCWVVCVLFAQTCLPVGQALLVPALQVDLVDYGMNSVSQGIEAMASTRVVIRPMDGSSGVTPQVMDVQPQSC